MKSLAELQERVKAREREFMLRLAPFAFVATAITMNILGTLAIGEYTKVSSTLFSIEATAAICLVWFYGPYLVWSYHRLRKAQHRLGSFQASPEV